ncbi:helix-turn-helix domain-containing protein [Nostoc cycadae]|uniref:Helix-turn-helix protein n=1 Tax=Nostoc cycadae WK-1 TaxID=1861711 RepID=A0A2H6LR77_9NOSO|nr:helix-turn-helix transcriptional regulator [Nostoc cycadae]GBE95727.1 helix-turn-helix protein [Nostoc cycadae WK-1]
MQIHEIFKMAMDKHGIKGKDLAEKVGIGKDHLSQFRCGKKWVSPEVFVKLLEGMDELAPGSRKYFCELLANEPLGKGQSSLVKLVENANEEEIDTVLSLIGYRWKTGIKNHSNHSAIAV